ncbi:MAG: hypothetical protein AAFN77_05980 [Planctomycetota bacterium]
MPTWKRSESDCVIKQGSWKQRRITIPEQQNRFERIEFVVAGQGTRSFITHDVAPALVISELQPSIRFRAAEPGARLYVRVVLPDTPSPKGDGPMTCLLRGPMYRNSGKWETLSFARSELDLAELLQEEIWILRNTHGEHVSKKGAYVDKIALNIYQGPGFSRVEMDDLRMEGVVSAQPGMDSDDRYSDPNVMQTSGTQQDGAKPKALVVREGTVLLAKGKPFFPRIIDHNGEKFEFLRALGFNVIQLRRTATYEQLQEASQLDLWLICPPPSTVGIQPIPFHFDRVLAWSVGQGLTGRNVASVEQRVREIRESDSRFGRLVVGHAEAEWTQIARVTDVLNAGVEPIGTSFIASQYSDWLTARRNSISNQKPVWADIQTELSAALINQVRSLTRHLPPLPLEPQQIRFLVYESIVGGARGMRFRSRTRLDGIDPVTVLRTLTIRWVNAELDQLEPWIVGGALMGPLPKEPQHPNLEVTAINTRRSRLLLVQRPTHHEQYVAGDQPLTGIGFRDAASPFTDNAYLLGQSGLVTLANTRDVTGTEINLDQCPYLAAVVLTQDPMVVHRLTESYNRINSESALTMHLQLTQQWMAIQQLIDEQMGKMGRGSVAASSALNEAVAALRNAVAMTQQNNLPSAESFLNIANERLALSRRELITNPLGMFQSKTSAPLTTHCSLVPIHWSLAGKLADGKWNPNGLGGGDFEDLELMQRHGWQNRRLDVPTLATQVELTRDAAFDGQYGLKLTVAPQGSSRPKLVETPPLIIESPAIPVRAGQLVRVHGWVRVPSVILGSMDGLKITDSMTGNAMAERIPITNDWQEFTLYRSAAANGVLSIRFEMTGIGTASLDEVTIRTIDLPRARPDAARQAQTQFQPK